jgi:peptide/nickel transport system permease protein
MTALRRTFATTYVRIAGFVLFIVLVLVIFGGVVAPDNPLTQNVSQTFAPLGAHGHILGTDYLGRDVFSRLLAGTRDSVVGALAMVVIGVIAGAIPGLYSALSDRTTTFILQRANDSLMTLPPVVFAIALAGFFTDGELSVILAIGVLLAPRFFRITRAETLGFAHQQYVEAATLMGASRWWIVRHHIWRKVVPTVAVAAATATGWAVLASASLGFLGLGVQAPAPTWGGMLADDVEYLSSSTVAPIWPGLAIAITVWALNAIADGLRDGLAVGSAAAPGRAAASYDPSDELGSGLSGAFDGTRAQPLGHEVSDVA